jgi:hypothetical protein
MTTDTSNPADAVVDDADDGADDKDLKKAIAKRQAAKAEAEALKSELKKYKDAEKAAAEKAAREAQDWATLEKAYQAQLKERDDRLAQIDAEKAAIAKKERAAKFAQTVTAQAGLPADALASVRAHLLLMQEEEGMDIAPTDGVEILSKEAVKKLRKSAPNLFPATSLGPKGSPGLPPGREPTDDERLKMLVDTINRK